MHSVLLRQQCRDRFVTLKIISSHPSIVLLSAELTNHLGGGYPTTTNRTYWPTTGGAVAFQPGWFQGHQTAFIYINLGYGTDGPYGGPENMSNPMVSPFQIIGPTANPYAGTVCLPEVPLPANASVKAGDNATIQVVEIAKHGAALFSVSLHKLSCPTALLGTGVTGHEV